MTDSISQVPKYQVAKEYILDFIENKNLSPHERLPSEAELVKKLNVSTITVRRALSELVDEGIIYRVKGKGTFLAEPKPEIETGSKLITFVLSGYEMHDHSYIQIIKGIQSYLSKYDFKLVIEFIENDVEKEVELIQKIIQTDCAGLLIYSSNPEAVKGYILELQEKQLPVVLLDRFPIGVPLPCIACNNHEGAFLAVQHLISLGHEKIGFSGYDFFLNSEKERYLGYVHAMMNAELPIDDRLLFPERELDYKNLVDKIKAGDITALFCVNDRRALEVIHQLSNMEIKIPEDISIVGFDDFESSKFAQVPLTTVQQPFEQLGYEAAKLLLELCKQTSITAKKILLPTKLVVRDSTAPPKSNRE